MNKNELKKRFIIGTANFTQKYGADPKEIDNDEIKRILNLAKKNKIYSIDTAKAYLKKKNIFEKIDKKFKILTKITPDSRWISLEFCQIQLENHFKTFNKNKVETLLFHDIKFLFTKNGLKVFKNLEFLKKKKFFKKIGVSIYDPSCLGFLSSNYNFNVVQCPFNILDKRILMSGWFDKLKDNNVEVHVRSVFLQGLLVNKLVYKKKYFNKWKKFFFEWFRYLENKNISPIDYCLSNLTNYDFDQIIIGVNNHKNLNEIINFKMIKKNIELKNFDIDNIKLYDPRKWK